MSVLKQKECDAIRKKLIDAIKEKDREKIKEVIQDHPVLTEDVLEKDNYPGNKTLMMLIPILDSEILTWLVDLGFSLDAEHPSFPEQRFIDEAARKDRWDLFETALSLGADLSQLNFMTTVNDLAELKNFLPQLIHKGWDINAPIKWPYGDDAHQVETVWDIISYNLERRAYVESLGGQPSRRLYGKKSKHYGFKLIPKNESKAQKQFESITDTPKDGTQAPRTNGVYHCKQKLHFYLRFTDDGRCLYRMHSLPPKRALKDDIFEIRDGSSSVCTLTMKPRLSFSACASHMDMAFTGIITEDGDQLIARFIINDETIHAAFKFTELSLKPPQISYPARTHGGLQLPLIIGALEPESDDPETEIYNEAYSIEMQIDNEVAATTVFLVPEPYLPYLIENIPLDEMGAFHSGITHWNGKTQIQTATQQSNKHAGWIQFEMDSQPEQIIEALDSGCRAIFLLTESTKEDKTQWQKAIQNLINTLKPAHTNKLNQLAIAYHPRWTFEDAQDAGAVANQLSEIYRVLDMADTENRPFVLYGGCFDECPEKSFLYKTEGLDGIYIAKNNGDCANDILSLHSLILQG